MQLFERDADLDHLSRWLDQAAAGDGCLVLLGGEAGVGKTALVRRFCQEVADRARVLIGACDALSTPRPLGPLLEIAAQIGGEIDRLLQAEARREQVFGACLREFSGAWRPVVAVFEDVHWADEATLDLLRFLGRRIGSCRAVLIATYRDDEIGPMHPWRAVLGDLATATAVRRMPLAPLTIEAVRRMAADRQLDAETLHRQTGGNPFYVTEVLAAGGGIPSTVRDAVLTRAARLSPAGRATLDLAAVAGSPVESSVLGRLAPSLDAIDECLTTGTLRTDGQSVTFRHELAREAILDAISPPRQTAFHARMLRELEADPETREHLARLTHHAEAAGNGDAVLTYAPAAARRAA
ncbi:MAG: ATP-binding protein, partial [Thermomicrobiales bacterium]